MTKDADRPSQPTTRDRGGEAEAREGVPRNVSSGARGSRTRSDGARATFWV